MGLAVLPSRLKTELTLLEHAIVTNQDLSADPILSKHASWVAELRQQYDFTPDNTAEILRREVGKVFAGVLEDAGVYKHTPAGHAAFLDFIQAVNLF